MLDRKIIKNVIDMDKIINNEKPNISELLLICNESILKVRDNKMLNIFLRIKYNAENILAEGQHKAREPDGKRFEMIKQEFAGLKEMVRNELSEKHNN